VLVIFIVGLALTIARAVTKSVAASLIMHMAYNATLSVLLFIGTDGFRHLERLNQ
jgi:membrane protease YdiL (CAAX protease family)